ncbi:MAG: hypothetical protein KDD61_09275 [Bdellovibrionales bacterium]|nr:hypothetical protein [Bdellovibrionales bacterium]
MTLKLVVLGLIFFFHGTTWSLEIPTGLQKADLEKVIRILGLPTSTKLVSDPYPLGGYDGLELGLSLEIVRTTDLGHLGNKTSTQREFQFPRLSVGKGLYNDVDLFFHFIPYSKESQVSEFGGLIRWTFYKGNYLPISWSLMAHGNSLNVADRFINETYGVEMLIGLNAEDFSIYFGGGQLSSTGKFVRAVLDETDTTFNLIATDNSRNASVYQLHTFVGINFALYESLFIALQVDRYDEPVYSAKIGFNL